LTTGKGAEKKFMENKKLQDYKEQDVLQLIGGNADAVIVVDAAIDSYKTVICRGILKDEVGEAGKYSELIEKLWFHFNNTQDKITKEYQVFIPNFGKFKGKYSRRLKLFFEGDTMPRVFQMTVYPVGDEKYLFLMDELDNSEYMQEFMTSSKVKTIQNTYLFSMYVDLVQNTTNSISITEISDENVHSSISYTDWRMMIVNMIWPDDRKLFMERTDPEYLKSNFTPGRTSSFDCLMQNLEGKFIWVKLIFSRSQTTNEDDFRFVFMVQNIHEESVELLSELKHYEELASRDPMTSIFHHGRMETELANALDARKKHNKTVSIMILDIDYFKQVNDRFGHSVGDHTLKCFAEILTDTLGRENAVVGRWGGEEFVAVCYEKNRDEAIALAENLRKRVSEASFAGAGKITCSIGVTEIEEADGAGEAFERMDKALYRAKSEGRNRVCANFR